jgi:hypothetical protein
MWVIFSLFLFGLLLFCVFRWPPSQVKLASWRLFQAQKTAVTLNYRLLKGKHPNLNLTYMWIIKCGYKRYCDSQMASQSKGTKMHLIQSQCLNTTQHGTISLPLVQNLLYCLALYQYLFLNQCKTKKKASTGWHPWDNPYRQKNIQEKSKETHSLTKKRCGSL